MIEIKTFESLIIVLGIAVMIITVLRRLHLPPILGYLIAGALVGPEALGLFSDLKDLHFIAEFGVVFLLFTIGLELSLPKLIAMRRALLSLGGGQVLLCALIVVGFCRIADLSWAAATAVAGALTFSSTAVATKQLIEQDELHQPHGKYALSILLFQDIAAIPFLIIVPALGGNTGTSLSSTLLHALIMGAIVVSVMLAAGRWLLRPLFHQIAFARSSELFMLATLLVVLASAFLSEHVGLSLALGGFLAGVMLAETEFSHQIESDIQPFRDILLGLFFITVGMMLSPTVLFQEWPWVLLIVIGLIVIKAFIITMLAVIGRSPLRYAIKAGLALAQGGEFGFALLALALNNQLINPRHNQIVIAAIIISIAIAPFLIRNSRPIALWLTQWQKKEDILPEEDAVIDTEHMDDHVIICGYGRVGQTLARFLEQEGIPFIGLDLDPLRLKEATLANEPVFYGDASNDTTLEAVGIHKARLILIAFDDPPRAEKALHHIRRLNPEIPVLVRSNDDRHLEALQNAGATEVIPEKLESSLMLAIHMLILLGDNPEEAQQKIWEVKSSRYYMLRGFYQGSDDTEHLENLHAEHESLHAIELTEGAYAVGKSVEELKTKDFRLQVNAFFRDGFKCDEPSPHTTLKVGDVLVLQGTSDTLYLAEEKLLQG
ncbi:MAG: cation:proton antiporter [Gammaproteobacteria bacterium]